MYETESLDTYSLLTETTRRLTSFTVLKLGIEGWFSTCIIDVVGDADQAWPDSLTVQSYAWLVRHNSLGLIAKILGKYDNLYTRHVTTIYRTVEAGLIKSHLRKFGKWESKTNVVFFLSEK